MPFKVVRITVRPEWREEPGDGSECCVCGEQAWLTQKRLWLVCRAGEIPHKTIICASCKEDQVEIG